MKSTKIFKNFEDFENYVESVEDYEIQPSIIDDGFKIAMDFETECKSWKTALKRFEKLFGDYNEEVAGWVECMRESCGSGYFSDDGWRPCHPGVTTEEISEAAKYGTYSWGVEEFDGGTWYIFLNISGIYAGRENN